MKIIYGCEYVNSLKQQSVRQVNVCGEKNCKGKVRKNYKKKKKNTTR